MGNTRTTTSRRRAAAKDKPAAATATGPTAEEAAAQELSDIEAAVKAANPTGVQAKIGFIQTHIGDVKKTGRVSFGNSNYAHMQEHGLIEVLRPFLRALHLSLHADVPQRERNGNHTFVSGTLVVVDNDEVPFLTHADGSPIVVEGSHTIPNPVRELHLHFPNEGVDSQDKGTNKALTGWMKYALQKTFLIPTDKIDDNDQLDGSVPQSTATAAHAGGDKDLQVSNLRNAIAAAVNDGRVTQNDVLGVLQGTYGTDKLDQLSPEQLTGVEAWLKQR